MAFPKVGVFIFHRDLRLDDNKGLLKALDEMDVVIPIFIFTPSQVSEKNTYRSSRSVQFMIESLIELDDCLNGKLLGFYGEQGNIIEDIVNNVFKKIKINTIYENRDYSPYAINRQNNTEKIAQLYNINYELCDDISLQPIQNYQPYKIFSPFYKKYSSNIISKPQKLNSNQKNKLDWSSLLSKDADLKKMTTNVINNYSLLSIIDNTIKKIPDLVLTNKIDINIKGGRAQGLKKLSQLKSNLINYYETRDIPSVPTSYLSAHLQFGTVSPREAYWAFHELSDLKPTKRSLVKLNDYKPDLTIGKKTSQTLIQQLYWRDYYFLIVYYYHTDYSKTLRYSYRSESKYNLKNQHKLWIKNDADYRKKLIMWKTGNTGIPLVDAGMRQLNQTGYMHNRLRMVVGIFLIHYLQINWVDGEKYFAQNLVDYSYANNFGGWLWCTGFETHSMDIFKLFSMESQMKRFDPNGIYVKKWIPELSGINPKELNNWETHYKKYPEIDYPNPIIKNLKKIRLDRIKTLV